MSLYLSDPSVLVSSSPALTPQQRTIIEYLQAGRSLTNQVAINNLGIGSLTSRIAELRKKGYAITDTTEQDFHGKDYKKYALKGATKPESA